MGLTDVYFEEISDILDSRTDKFNSSLVTVYTSAINILISLYASLISYIIMMYNIMYVCFSVWEGILLAAWGGGGSQGSPLCIKP